MRAQRAVKVWAIMPIHGNFTILEGKPRELLLYLIIADLKHST